MFGLPRGCDDNVLKEFEAQEIQNPSPRKEVDGRTIYYTRRIPQPPQVGTLVLGNFGSAMFGEKERSETVQPKLYRRPESLLGVP